VADVPKESPKRQRVRKVLSDAAWRGKSVWEISRHCRVSRYLVYSMMKEMGIEPPPTREYITPTGNVAVMPVANIGKKSREAKLARALGAIGRVLDRYAGMRALAPIREAYRAVKEAAQDRQHRKKGA